MSVADEYRKRADRGGRAVHEWGLLVVDRLGLEAWKAVLHKLPDVRGRTVDVIACAIEEVERVVMMERDAEADRLDGNLHGPRGELRRKLGERRCKPEH